jgi:hypothetical protein
MGLTTKQFSNAVLSTSALTSHILGVDTVDQVVFSKEAVQKILTAHCKQYSAFSPSGYFAWPRGQKYLKLTGIVAFTAMAMVDSDKEDFRFCHEDLAAKIKFPKADYASKKYRFLHGGLISEKDKSKGDDPIIKPDGMVQFFFDSRKGLKDQYVAKEPRTVAQLSAEHGMTDEQKAKFKGDVSYSIFPTLYNKSFYAENEDALEDIVTMREKVAQALCRTNSMADQGQLVQVLGLGFVSGYYIMHSLRNSTIEKRKKGLNVPLAPYGVALFMPTWTILSREIIRTPNDFFPTLTKNTGYGFSKPVRSMTADYKKLGLPWVDPVEDNYSDLWEEASKAIQAMGDASNVKETIRETKKNAPDSIKLTEDNINKDVSSVSGDDVENPTGSIPKAKAYERRRKTRNRSSLGLDSLPESKGSDSADSADSADSKKKVESEKPPTKRRRYDDAAGGDVVDLSRGNRK